MKYLLIALPLVIMISCATSRTEQQLKQKELLDRIKYVKNPKKKDKLCVSEINKAKQDVAKGKIVFTQKFGFGTSKLRYEKELTQLCQQYGLEFDIDLIGCVIEKGQTQGCYSDYMDKIIIEKFGIDFKEKLHKRADSLFLVNITKEGEVVEYWDCDERPRLPNENKRTGDYLGTIAVAGLEIVKNDLGNPDYPFFDLGFIIEKDNTVSNFHIRSWVAKQDKNEKMKEKLYQLAIDYVKNKYPQWIPGKIAGIPVRTHNNVRIYFRNKTKRSSSK